MASSPISSLYSHLADDSVGAHDSQEAGRSSRLQDEDDIYPCCNLYELPAVPYLLGAAGVIAVLTLVMQVYAEVNTHS